MSGDFEYGPQAPPEYFEKPGPSEYEQALSHIMLYVSDESEASELLISIEDGNCPLLAYTGGPAPWRR